MENIYEYEVAFSFADEDREYVEEVATFLNKQNISVFYDNFQEDNLWGKSLVPFLEEIYTHKAKYCVIFISQYYIQKKWTCYEIESAMCRMLKNNVEGKEYLLPVKFDDAKVPGILDTIGFVDGRKKTPEELGRLIIKKIAGKTKTSSQSLTIEKFREYMVKSLTTDFPDHWKVTCKESTQEINIKYSFLNFDYFFKILSEADGKTFLISGEYTDIFFDTNILALSVKIILNASEEIINSAEIINFDFFDYMDSDPLNPWDVVRQIKKEILKKGGI